MAATRLIVPQYRLITAEILYRRPDHPVLLQSFVWQTRDETPDFPRLHEFLAWWSRTLDGALHSVRLYTGERATGDWRPAADYVTMH